MTGTLPLFRGHKKSDSSWDLKPVDVDGLEATEFAEFSGANIDALPTEPGWAFVVGHPVPGCRCGVDSGSLQLRGRAENPDGAG